MNDSTFMIFIFFLSFRSLQNNVSLISDVSKFNTIKYAHMHTHISHTHKYTQRTYTHMQNRYTLNRHTSFI